MVWPLQCPFTLPSLSHSPFCCCVCAVCMLHAHPRSPHLQEEAEGLMVSWDPALWWLGMLQCAVPKVLPAGLAAV